MRALFVAVAVWVVALAGAAQAATCPVPSNTWPCLASPAGTAAQSTDQVLGFRPSLGANGQGPFTVQQILNALTAPQVQAALGAAPLLAPNNLGDVPSPATALTNLGGVSGTVPLFYATVPAPAFNATGAGYQQNGSLVLNIPGGTNGGVLAIGAGAAASAPVGTYYLWAVGQNALGSYTAQNGEVTAAGWGTLRNLTTGQFDSAFGHNAGGALTTESGDTVLGEDSMRSSTGAGNTGAGSNTLKYGAFANSVGVGDSAFDSEQQTNPITNVTYSVAVGVNDFSGANLGTVSFLTALGANIGLNVTTATELTCLGYQTCNATTSQSGLTMAGFQAGFNSTGTKGNYFGAGAGWDDSGTGNLILGNCSSAYCKANGPAGNTNIIIGNNANVPNPSGNNQLSIGNALFGLGTNGVDANVAGAAFGFGTNAPNAGVTIGQPGIFGDGHLGFLAASAPPISATGGTATLDATANDEGGEVTAGSGVTQFTVSFVVAYKTTPHCVVSSPSGALPSSYTKTTTGLTVNYVGAATWDYGCFQ